MSPSSRPGWAIIAKTTDMLASSSLHWTRPRRWQQTELTAANRDSRATWYESQIGGYYGQAQRNCW
eukprot:scaffold210267_cov19-Prasinocladus_malaysianus.AAC.2